MASILSQSNLGCALARAAPGSKPHVSGMGRMGRAAALNAKRPAGSSEATALCRGPLARPTLLALGTGRGREHRNAGRLPNVQALAVVTNQGPAASGGDGAVEPAEVDLLVEGLPADLGEGELGELLAEAGIREATVEPPARRGGDSAKVTVRSEDDAALLRELAGTRVRGYELFVRLSRPVRASSKQKSGGRGRKVSPDVKRARFFRHWEDRRAWEAADALRDLGSKAGAHEITWMIKLCAGRRNLNQARRWWDALLDAGHEPNMAAANALLGAACRSHLMAEAERAVEGMRRAGLDPDRETWMLLVNGYAHKRDYGGAVRAFEGFKAAGYLVDDRALAALVHAACKAGDLWRARELVDEMPGSDPGAALLARNLLADGLARKGRVKDVEKLMGSMETDGLVADEYSWGALVRGNCTAGRMDDAMDAAGRAREGSKVPDAGHMNMTIYTLLIDGWGRRRRPDRAVDVLREARDAGVGALDMRAYGAAINACCQGNKIDRAVELLEELKAAGHRPNKHIQTMVVSRVADRGQLARAATLLRSFRASGCRPSTGAYNALLDAAYKAGRDRMVASLLWRMERDGIAWDEHTHTVVMDGQARAGDADGAIASLARIRGDDAAAAPDIPTYGVLVKACADAGRFEEVEKLLGEMAEEGTPPDDRCFNTIIAACARAGDVARAAHFLRAMKDAGHKPDVYTITPLVDVHARAGDMEAAERVLESARASSVPVNLRTFTPLAEGYMRGGMLQEGVDVLERMKSAGCPADKFLYWRAAGLLLEYLLGPLFTQQRGSGSGARSAEAGPPAGYSDEAVVELVLGVLRDMQESGVKLNPTWGTEWLLKASDLGTAAGDSLASALRPMLATAGDVDPESIAHAEAKTRAGAGGRARRASPAMLDTKKGSSTTSFSGNTPSAVTGPQQGKEGG